MKKVGWYLMSILPVLVMIEIQIVGSSVIVTWYMLCYGITEGAQMLFDNLIGVTFVTQVMTLFISGLWYYLWIFREKKQMDREERPSFSIRSLGSILCLAIGAQCLIGILLAVWQYINPEQIDAYSEMIEQAGINDFTVIAVIATIIMAPIGEEIVCRGLSIECLKRAGAGFWVINVIQAVLFGIMHLNLVQGTYAFFVGLICGYLALKYKTLLASMFFHFCFNAYSVLGAPILNALEAGNPTVYYTIYFIVGLMAFPFGIWLLRKDTKKKEDRGLPGVGIGI